MEITLEQYARIETHLPVQRGNVSHQNLNVINAILFVAENGCKWRLPKRFGNWHTIYTRMNAGRKPECWIAFADSTRERPRDRGGDLEDDVKVHPDAPAL